MRLVLPFLAGFLAATAADAVRAQTDAPAGTVGAQKLLPQGDIIEREGARIRIPRGWRRIEEVETKSHVLHLVGDGMGAPLMDEVGTPLQLGIAVEHFTDDAKALLAGLESKAAGVRGARMEREEVALTGGTPGVVLYISIYKGDGRTGLYEQLVVADPRQGSWLVTGWIVASKESAYPTRGSALEQRLASFIRSFKMVPQAQH